MLEEERKKIMAWVCTGTLRTGGPLRYACAVGLGVSPRPAYRPPERTIQTAGVQVDLRAGKEDDGEAIDNGEGRGRLKIEQWVSESNRTGFCKIR